MKKGGRTDTAMRFALPRLYALGATEDRKTAKATLKYLDSLPASRSKKDRVAPGAPSLPCRMVNATTSNRHNNTSHRIGEIAMRLDVKGRIRNVSLPASKPLLPLYEAIVNSIQAIEDARETKGNIEITILRDGRKAPSDRDGSVGLGDIIGFEVSDNGIGFNDENYTAFETSDTTYKQSRGGKGVGRFLWLVAFTKVEVESHFQDNGATKVRRFAFLPEGEGVQNPSCTASDRATRLTTVRLTGFQPKYQETCPKKTETIAAHIVEHCLEFFIRRNCPRIILMDRQSGDSLELNRISRPRWSRSRRPTISRSRRTSSLSFMSASIRLTRESI